MKIDEDLLIEHGAVYQSFQAKENIFFAEDTPRSYMQITNGSVELNNFLDDGKEVTVGIFSEGNSIAESLLFTEQPYPMNCVAKTDCTILKLKKSSFLAIIESDSSLAFHCMQRLSADLVYYYNMQKIVAESQPVSKIKSLLDYFKAYSGGHHGAAFQVPLTRNEIAKLVGLRVETVIRAVKKMEQESLLAIKKRKIYY